MPPGKAANRSQCMPGSEFRAGLPAFSRSCLELAATPPRAFVPRLVRTGADSADMRDYHELFNNALTLAKWAVRETEQRRAILSLDETTGKTRELMMPFLEAVGAKLPLPPEAEPAEQRRVRDATTQG